MGFTRRFQYFPGSSEISLIEGVVIVDLPPPGQVIGVGTGTTSVIGEFTDMTFACAVDQSTGVVTTFPQPVEVFSSADLIVKGGGFDETLGDFGGDDGNGFVAVRNKKFSRLIIVPVNLCSSNGVRVWRQLPTNKGATDPNPIVPMQSSTVIAGREFRDGANRVRLGQAVTFTSAQQYDQGTDGSVTNASSAVTQTFTSAGSNFLTAKNGKPVDVGDILVLGVIGASGAQGANAASYRVATVAPGSDVTLLDVEAMDGEQYAFTTGSSLAWRLHDGFSASTTGKKVTGDVGAYTVLARTLDASVANRVVITPTVVPPSGTATSWDPLSGLDAKTMPTGSGGLSYDSAIQAPNAATSAGLRALYSSALDSLLSTDVPARDVNIVFAARTDSTGEIQSFLKQHVLTSSSTGTGRTCTIAPPISTVGSTAPSTVTSDSAPGVGSTRDERVDYSWPGALTFVREAVNFSIKGADGNFYNDGNLDTRGDGWLASVLSILPPERNPGQGAPPVPATLAPILGIQRGVSGLGMSQYILFKQKGICALTIDKTIGPQFQSGVTSSLIPGELNINRRRMADFIEDSLAQAYQPFTKLPLTNQLKDGVAAETFAFLNGLLSPNNPAAQRISAFAIDTKSGNTDDLEAQGIFVIVVSVRTLATADDIVLVANIGESVEIQTQ